MIPALKAEFQKILTVRSTFVIIGLATVMALLIAHLEGYRRTMPIDPEMVSRGISGTAPVLSLLFSLIGLLLITHEYRYNTIAYSLTSSRHRLTVLLAKIIAVSAVSVVLAVIFCTLTPVLLYLATQLKGLEMVPQSIAYSDVVWRSLFMVWAYSMLALVIAMLVRSQVGALVTLLLFPAIGENLLGLLLKEKAAYLPFSALNSIINQSSAPSEISSQTAALTVLVYLVAGWVVAAVLFMRRDAN